MKRPFFKMVVVVKLMLGWLDPDGIFVHSFSSQKLE
jgi:hypothetical protein